MMPLDARYPREGEVYEAVEDVAIDYLTYYFDIPYTGGGDATLPKGERVRVSYARRDKPLGVFCDPLNYDALQEKIVAPDKRSDEMYRGYYLAICTDVLNKSFKLVADDSAGGNSTEDSLILTLNARA